MNAREEWTLVENMTMGVFVLDYNENHDPKNGQFASKGYIDVTKDYYSDATPGQGFINYDEGYNKAVHVDEIAFAKWLHGTLGGNIQLVKEANMDKVLSPDFIWDGRAWELKTPTTAAAADSALRKGIKQVDGSGGIILNYPDKSIPLAKIMNVVVSRFKRTSLDCYIDVMIIQGGNISKIIHKR